MALKNLLHIGRRSCQTTLFLFLLFSVVSCQEDESEEDAIIRRICKGKSAGEFFRLSVSDRNCRSVAQCTSGGLQGIRCPPGLAFDLEKQTCDWRKAVKNCDKLTKEKKVKPLLATDEPICQENFLACGDGNCIERGLFCNGEPDCNDGSDENSCGVNTDPNRAPLCDNNICKLPDCFCSEDGTKVPGNLCPSSDKCDNVPQMITITFDDAINNNNVDLYREIFDRERGFERRNPNGCNIKGTFFVSHKYSNYRDIQEIHRLGHEIAAHSVTHRDSEDFWSEASVEEWAKEMAGSRLIIEKFANITDNSVIGLRAPFLRVGGNNQFTMMEEQSFLYDSSITAPLSNPPLWPYTMYFRMPHRCHGNKQNCPTRSHAVWEMVMNELDRREDPEYEEEIQGCAMVDSCSNIVTGDQFYNFLTHNFYRHFDTNRAPLGLFFHAAWLKNNPEFLDAFLYWIDEVIENHGADLDGDGNGDDVYFVTMTQVIQWIQNPQSKNDAKSFEPWREKCTPRGDENPNCDRANRCKLSTDELPGQALYMHTCMPCPHHYPWFNNPTGDGIIGSFV